MSVGLSNVVCIADAILVFGKNTEEHDEMLQKLLLRCSEKNIKLNKEKCVFNTSKISFLSHVITCNGLEASKKKTDAVSMMSVPIDKE